MYENHSGKSILDRCLTALDGRWRQKINGVPTDGAASMTGVGKGWDLRLQTVASPGMYRVWCGSHQIDLSMKKVLQSLPGDFMITLTTMIGYLWRQQKFISEIKCKSLYYISVRWSSLAQVTFCIGIFETVLLTFPMEKYVPCWPNDEWWLMLIVLDKFLDMIKSTSASLQGNNLTLGQKIIQLSSLVRDLESAIGESRTPNVKIKEENILLEGAGTAKSGTILCEVLQGAWAGAIKKPASTLSHAKTE